MRLLYLCADRGIPVAGSKGASIHLRAVVEALERRGHQLTVLAASAAGAEDLDFEVRDIGFDRPLKRLRRDLAETTGNAALAGEMHGMLLNRRSRQELDRLHADAPVEAIYERYSLWSWEGLRFARANDLPLVLEVNAPLVAEQEAYRGLALAPAARSIAAEVIQGADTVVVPSRELVHYVRGEIARTGPTEVLPNGVDLELFRHPRPASELDAGGFGSEALPADFVVAFLGTLKPWHGIEPLLEAFQILLRQRPDARLLVIGDGPLRHAVESARDGWGVGRIHATGAVPHAQVPSWLACADVGVAPYPALASFYFSPLKVIEYMAAGLAVVGSHAGQLRDTVRHGETGLLVEPGDPRALADALLELAADPERCRRMGVDGRRYAFEHHGWDGVAERIEQLTARLVARTPSTGPSEVSRWA